MKGQRPTTDIQVSMNGHEASNIELMHKRNRFYGKQGSHAVASGYHRTG